MTGSTLAAKRLHSDLRAGGHTLRRQQEPLCDGAGAPRPSLGYSTFAEMAGWKLSVSVVPLWGFGRVLFSQVRQMFAHSRGHVFCSRGTTQIAENFSPQSIGTGEHLRNDGIDDGQVSRSGLVIGKKLRPTVAQIDSLARQRTREDWQSGID
jgi:hypothetical protein